MRLTPLVPLTLLALGCGGEGTSETDTDTDTDVTAGPDCGVDGATLAAGTGYDAFVPLADGDMVFIVFGPQGGWHIDVGGAVAGTGSAVRVSAVITLVSQDMVISGAGSSDLGIQGLSNYDPAACSGVFYKVQALVDDFTAPVPNQQFICSLKNKDLEIEMTIEDLQTGVTATDTKIVKAMPDNSNNCP